MKALEEVLSKHKRVFQEGLGMLQGYKATLHVDPNASRKSCKARTVPYTMQELVEKELDRLGYFGTSTVCRVGCPNHASVGKQYGYVAT